jgi:glutathione peroxidase
VRLPAEPSRPPSQWRALAIVFVAAQARRMTVHEFSARTIDGKEKSLRDYAGKVLLIVNVASQCGLTPQYRGLQELYAQYRERGFEVLGFPCNQFGGQEPGSEDEIRSFCETRYNVSFPLFAKIEVNGPRRHPLYAFLTEQPTEPDGPGNIQWNFAKFLVDREGRVVARFAPTTPPVSEEVLGVLERALG